MPRLYEPEARILALQIAASFPNHIATTTEIKERVPRYHNLTHEDHVPSKTRHNEELWQQVVGNIVSHQESSRSIFNMGYAERTRDGIRVLEKGLSMLRKRGLYE